MTARRKSDNLGGTMCGMLSQELESESRKEKYCTSDKLQAFVKSQIVYISLSYS